MTIFPILTVSCKRVATNGRAGSHQPVTHRTKNPVRYVVGKGLSEATVGVLSAFLGNLDGIGGFEYTLVNRKIGWLEHGPGLSRCISS